MAPEDYQEEDSFCFNVGGWLFSIPKSKLLQFHDSVLWQEASSLVHSEDARLFIDRDGYTFRHVHYYLHTSKLSFSCISEITLLYEQATAMCLTSLQQALDNMKESKHHLRVRPEDVPVTQRTSRNYWRTRCNSKPSDFQIKSPAFTGLPDKAPLGLIDTPLLDTEEEVHWYFLPLNLVKKYPTLINEDNLLWLCEDVVLIEIGWSNFRYIANFLLTGKFIVPDKFSEVDALLTEMEMLQIPELIEAVKSYKRKIAGNSKDASISGNSVHHSEVGCESECAPAYKPLYVLVLELLVKYPDSALGQLCIESSLDGMKLYIFGNGVLFQHVRSWLGTCRLPLTEDVSQMCAVCVFLDRHDSLYQPVKDAMRLYLQKRKRETLETRLKINISDDGWTADVDSHTLHQIVKVYVGNYWYATYLNTFLKYPELLYNRNKARWIAYGKTLFIIGDGQMFRHIINFLRFDQLYIPSGFKEWPLLCQEIEDCKIPALSEALQNCEQYRIWYAENEVETVTAEAVDIPAETAKSVSSMELHESMEEKENVLNHVTQQEHPSDANTEIDQCRLINLNWSNKTTQSRNVSMNPASKSYNPTLSPRKARKTKFNTVLVGDKQITEESSASGNEVCLEESVSPPRKRTAKPHHNGQTETMTSVAKFISLVNGRKNNNTEKAGLLSSTVPKGNQFDKSMDFNNFDSWPHNTGFIIKVHHPLLLGNDGYSEFYTDSVLYMKYSTDVADAQFGHSERSQITGLASLIFNLSYEEIFYARECNHFLTGIILDSYTLKDPRQITWEILHLANFLWTEQITPETFVSKLLNLKTFKNHKQLHDKLVKWLTLTLPFARKYSHCMELLLKKGYYKSVSFPVLGN
ncbi:BTB/POZ domain-containing protein KCTD19-like isoform X1 [Leucoraja erinacea]|uniref:BTB/POZ domain-containing protein KCTD19-like isoform X1 n=1 Tax=Leucoraja erinaceus TaxID=7782 RepID=UPI0024587861|nr:BTB/POZ domain-containing protein KCTD19-like isoform X1 [Leucoraja erinacea]XP_055504498.1 BTB/POZ domain-containing protein KCTD19-like isoform X1 [Leucoraja erinacea]